MAQALIVPTAPKLESTKDSEEVRKSLLDLASKINEAILGTGRDIDSEALTPDQKAALAGTSGTPSATNPYVSNSDPRLSGTGSTWATYTPTFTGFGTVTVFDAKWRNDGPDILLKITFTAGTPTATEARISLPGTMTSKADVPTLEVVGYMDINVTAGGPYVIYSEPSSGYITFGTRRTGVTGMTKQTGSVIATSAGLRASLEARIPI